MIVYQKARIFNPDSPTSGFYVQFNPNTLEYSAGKVWRTNKNLSIPNGNSRTQASEPEQQASPLETEPGATLSVRLFFHSYINDIMFSDVRPNVNQIRAFLPAASPTSLLSSVSGKNDKHTQPNSPRITFAWGTMIFTGTLESFQTTYQMFAFDGTPVQAEVAITIRGEDQDVTSDSINQILSTVTDTDFSQQDDTLFLSSVSWLFQ